MKRGMDLEQLTVLANCNRIHTQTYRPKEHLPKDYSFKQIDVNVLGNHDHSSEASDCHRDQECNIAHFNESPSFVTSFDNALLKTALLSCSKEQGLYMIGNIDRKVLGQTGRGHFCPVGGFNS